MRDVATTTSPPPIGRRAGGRISWRQHIIYVGFVGIFLFFAITLNFEALSEAVVGGVI